MYFYQLYVARFQENKSNERIMIVDMFSFRKNKILVLIYCGIILSWWDQCLWGNKILLAYRDIILSVSSMVHFF